MGKHEKVVLSKLFILGYAPTVGDLAGRVGLSLTTVQAILDTNEIIEVVTPPDQKPVRWQITKEGLTAIIDGLWGRSPNLIN